MNVLSREKQIEVIAALREGVDIRCWPVLTPDGLIRFEKAACSDFSGLTNREDADVRSRARSVRPMGARLA